MKHTRLLTSILSIKDDYHAKAHLKYEIKTLVCQLKGLLHEQHTIEQVLKRAIAVSQRLGGLYEAYLSFHAHEEQAGHSSGDFETFPERWQACYQTILLLQHQWFLSDERMITMHLYRLYQHLVVLLQSQNRAKRFPKTNQDGPQWIKTWLKMNGPSQWLDALVLIINDQENWNFEQYQAGVSHLSEAELERVASFLNQTNVKELVWTIFFYRMFPKKLFIQPPHPEKLISVKNRLDVFYEAIRVIYLLFTEELIQRGMPRIDDYLLYDGGLPSGAEIQKNEAYRELILGSLKSLSAHILHVDIETDAALIQDLFYAYKYWFNPNRLIDGVMNLKQHLLNGRVEDSEFWETRLRSYLYRLSTSQCIDLYGYFSNKDTCYLMKTLIAIQKNHPITWQTEWDERALQTLTNLYETLETVMEMLREILDARQIKTKPYKRRIAQKIISPGRRNREAILRALEIYQLDQAQRNGKIESLFNAIEE